MARPKRIKKEEPITDAQTLESLEQDIDRARQELEKTKLELIEAKKEKAYIPGREISPEEKAISDKHANIGNEKKALQTKIEAQKEYDNVRVTGKFMNRRAPGQPVKLPYLKYADDPVKWWPFQDGKVYTIPRGFADQINGGSNDDPCYYTPHFTQKEGAMNPDVPSSQIHNVDSSNKKYAFVSTSY